MNVETLKKYFVYRTDSYATQRDNGAYYKVNNMITDQMLRDHLAGKRTMGVYQIGANDTVKWACVDIDINKEVWNSPDFDYDKDWAQKVIEQINTIKRLLTDSGISGYAEFSGFKGAHVWIFFENPILTKTAKDLMDAIFKDMELVDKDKMHIEIFPKQTTLNGDKTGSLVKLPCGKHKRSGEFSYFFDDIVGIAPKLVKDSIINRVISPVESIFSNCSALDSIRKEAPLGTLNHSQRLALAYILLNVPEGETELRRLIEMQSDYDPDITNTQINHVKTHGYKPITCAKLQSDAGGNICPAPCANIKGGKSPIAFYYRHTNKMIPAEDEEDNFEFTNPLDLYKRIGNQYFMKQGGTWLLLSNCVVEFDKQITRDLGGGQVITTLEGRVIHDDFVAPIKMDATDLSKLDRFKAEIYNAVGNQGIFILNLNHFQVAVNKYTKTEKMLIKEYFGYDTEVEEDSLEESYAEPTCYISPSTFIDREGIHENTKATVDLSGKRYAKSLNIIKIEDDEEYGEVVDSIENDLLSLTEPALIHACLGHVFLPIIRPWLKQRYPKRYILFIKGVSGEGKSFLAENLQHFYGQNFQEYISWSGTPNSIEAGGYDFKDSLCLVDDWKLDNVKGQLSRCRGILQNFADNNTRSRLNQNADFVNTKPFRGTMIVTGEDFVEGQSSVAARIINLVYSQRIKDLKKGSRIMAMRNKYSAITGRYINHILNYPNKIENFSEIIKNNVEYFYEQIKGNHNDVRIATNLALLYSSYIIWAEWFWKNKPEQLSNNVEIVREYLVESASLQLKLAASQRPAERFWSTLIDAITSGKLRIQTTNSFDDTISRGTVIGFREAGITYLMMDLALTEVEKILKYSGDGLAFSNLTITDDLIREGIILNNVPETKIMNGQPNKFYKVKL